MAVVRIKISNKHLEELRQRLALEMENGEHQMYHPHQLLGSPDDMGTNGECRRCFSPIPSGYLVPGYGYVCEGCAVLLWTRGLVDLIDEANAAVNRFSEAMSAVTQSMRELHESLKTPEHTQSLSEVERPSLGYDPFSPFGPLVTDLPFEDLTSEPERIRTDLVEVEPESDTVTSLAEKPIPFHLMPPGTMIRTPLKPRGRFQHIEEDLPRMELAPITQRDVSILGYRTMTKKASEHIQYSPEFDVTSLPEHDRPLFDGYTAGQIKIANATDHRNYERSMGDPALMRLIQAGDDEEMLEGEQELARAKELRAGGATIGLRDGEGIRKVQTHSPELRARREAGLMNKHTPLQSFDD